MSLDLHLDENRTLAMRLKVIEILSSKVGGHDEHENTIEIDPETGDVYAVEWWDNMTCRGEPTSSGYLADKMLPTAELMKKVYDKFHK